MATPFEFTLYQSDGVTPDTTALANGLAVSIFRTRALADRSPATLSHMGSGVYLATPTDADEAIGVAGMITAPVGSLPSRLAFSAALPDSPFHTFLFTDNADALWAGAAPIGFGTDYHDAAGATRTPAALVAIAGTYLYTATPSAPDLAAKTNYKLAAAAGAQPVAYDGSFAQASSGGPPPSVVVPVVSNFTPALPGPTDSNSAIGFDVTVADATPLRNVSISIGFEGLDDLETAYDGAVFAPLYAGSNVTTITNGVRFSLTRRAGWIGKPIAQVRAVSITGVLNA